MPYEPFVSVEHALARLRAHPGAPAVLFSPVLHDPVGGRMTGGDWFFWFAFGPPGERTDVCVAAPTREIAERGRLGVMATMLDHNPDTLLFDPEKDTDVHAIAAAVWPAGITNIHAARLLDEHEMPVPDTSGPKPGDKLH